MRERRIVTSIETMARMVNKYGKYNLTVEKLVNERNNNVVYRVSYDYDEEVFERDGVHYFDDKGYVVNY